MAKETEEEKKQREMIETLASNIASLSRSVKELLSGRVNRKAIIVLLVHSTGMKQGEIDKVLSAIEGMEKTYLK